MKPMDIRKYLISKGQELKSISRREFDEIKKKWIRVYGSQRGKFDPSKHSDLYWEALSWEYCRSVEGLKADKAYSGFKQRQAFIVSDGSFSHKASFKASGHLPGLKTVKKFAHGDLYVMSPELDWVYIVTHEEYIGPFFSKAVWQGKKLEKTPPQISVNYERASGVVGFNKALPFVDRSVRRINRELRSAKRLISPVRWISLNCGVFPEEMGSYFGESAGYDERRGALWFRLKVDFQRFKTAKTREKARVILSLFSRGLSSETVRKVRIKGFDAHSVSRLIDRVSRSRG